MKWRRRRDEPEPPPPTFLEDVPWTSAPSYVMADDLYYGPGGDIRSRRDDRVAGELQRLEEQKEKALREARESEKPRMVNAPQEDFGPLDWQ